MTTYPRCASPRAELLRAVPGLGASSGRELARLARLVSEAEIPPSTVLIEQGAEGGPAYVIVEGWAAVAIHGEPVAALGPGQFVGEMALLDHGPRSATVVAKTPMRLLVLGPEAFEALAEQPAVSRAIAADLAERLRRVEVASPPEERPGPEASLPSTDNERTDR